MGQMSKDVIIEDDVMYIFIFKNIYIYIYRESYTSYTSFNFILSGFRFRWCFCLITLETDVKGMC